MKPINSKNIVSPKIVRVLRIVLSIMLISNLINRILYPWDCEVPTMLYFTVLINMLIGIYYLIASIFEKLRRNSITHALTTYIVIVGLVFIFFLDNGFLVKIYTRLSEHSINPTVHYISMINSILSHYIMPIIVAIDYFVMTDMRNTKVDYKVLFLPSIYLAVAITYGISTGHYAYPFLDTTFVGGWFMLVLVVIALAIIFLIISYLLWKLNCIIQNRIETYYRQIIKV